jgi:major type 1 subunit fimbrin (pilin)
VGVNFPLMDDELTHESKFLINYGCKSKRQTISNIFMKLYMKIPFSRSISAFAVGATLAALSGHALASDGTITFTGSIDASTCTVVTTGTGGSFTVALPQVSSSTLAAAGETAGTTAFTIKLTGCSDIAGNVSTNFEAGTAIDVATGRLKNTTVAGGATNVQIQLLNGNDGSPIVVGSPAASQNSHGVALTSDGATPPKGSATLNYFARYYATGASTAGSVASLVTYSMILP